MKRLVSVFLVLCMMLSCVAFGETLDGAQGEIMNEVSDVASAPRPTNRRRLL